MGIKPINRGGVEKLILLILFLGMLAFVSVTFFKERTVAKQTALYHELVMLRQGVNLFELTQKRAPSNLIDLAVSMYEMPDTGGRHRYVEVVQIGKNNKIIDPFGNPYIYDPGKGWVKSSTPGYTDW